MHAISDLAQLWLAGRRGRGGWRAIALGSPADQGSDDAAGNNDLGVVTVLQVRHEKRQHEPHC
jgi:hypothetical protein